MHGLIPFLVAVAYAIGLFAMAAWAERHRERFGQPKFRVPAHTLALAVYCTSWTFFGAVGSAASDGWSYLPIYLGPICVYLFAPGFLRRLIAAVQQEGATSISDFIGSRFGKSRGVAALVTMLALFGTIPYIALQLRSVGISYSELTGREGVALPMALTAATLALFAMLFGTRRYEASGRNEAVLYAVAAESLVKLAALVAVGGAAMLIFQDAPAEVQAAGLARLSANFALNQLDGDFVVITLLAMTAIVCLPRQFYIGVIEASSPDHVGRSRFGFIFYLVLTSIVVIPITLGGLTLLPGDRSPDMFVLDLPLATGSGRLAMFAFLGGFSAATAMVIVETIALSTMVSNDLIAPLLLRHPRFSGEINLGRTILRVRRAAILLVVGAGLAYALVIPPNQRLASIGLTAFAAMAQFAPALILAVRGPNQDSAAVKAGLTAGFVLWCYTLFLPNVAGPWLFEPVMGTLLDPSALLGLKGLSPISHGLLWSFGANVVLFALVAARRVRKPALSIGFRWGPGIGEVRDLGGLIDMVERFVGTESVSEAFGARADRAAPVDHHSLRTAERLIAGVIGAPSARAIMASALSGASLHIDDVARMLDASGQSLQFSKRLLAATLENIDPGVCVVGRELNLIAWNSRYLEMFQYPPGLVRVGAPVAELIRYNAERGECGPGEVEDHVERRLGHMRRGRPHSFERMRPNGQTLKTVGGPMPGGGYVMCYTDITAEAGARAAVERARAELESRVEQRTFELQVANAALARATREKTRFLAAASHDLLQPLHAARLFAAALGRDISDEARPILANVDRSIGAADALLRALLDISKLDAGGITPEPTRFGLGALIAELTEAFRPLAAEKGLSLRAGTSDALVETDRTLLRSILQNFLSNAVRYTARGGVVIGVRRRGGRVRIEIYDTGVGIAAEHQDIIFREFERLGTSGEAGIGLGLPIVERTARLLGASIDLRSAPGSGSRFAVELPAIAGERPQANLAGTPRCEGPIAGLGVLIVDDEADVRQATAMLFERWECRPLTAATPAGALALAATAEVALVDFHLGAEMDGIALIEALRAANPCLRVALVTADRAAATALRCDQGGIPILSKPLDPERLFRWLAGDARIAAE